MTKKRLLICGISMPCAGTEKALLSFLNTIDRAVYEVTLLLALPEGSLMQQFPKDIQVLGPMRFGNMFLLSSVNAPRLLLSFLLRHPTSLPVLLKAFCSALLRPSKRRFAAARMWVRLMKKYCPSFEEEFSSQIDGSEPFDLALSFWGDRTMFYVCDKVKALRHLTWLHFDYDHPPREDSLYHAYFSKCDRVISVTEDCTRLLRTRFPGLSDRMITFENRISPSRIRTLAAEPLPMRFPDDGRPLILTVARVCPQKGIDRIPNALRLLRERGISVRWCILGDRSEKELNALLASAQDLGVEDCLVLPGSDPNPYPYFAACDIFALPSRYEGKPITVEEAKILGCPIVVCDYLSARKQLENGTLGVIVPQDNGEGMATAIAALLESEPLREHYRAACLESVSEMPGTGFSQTDRLLSGEI